MKMNSYKTKFTTTLLVLLLTISATLTLLPTVNADDIPTYAFLSVAPNPVGVNQAVIVSMWLSVYPPMDAQMWVIPFEGFTVTITKPDGNQEIKGPYNSDAVGAQWLEYVPDSIGTYTFQFSFPGQQMSGFSFAGPTENYYEPSISNEVTLTVQEDQLEFWPAAELPTEYWERPINAQNREWSKISGSWLGIPTGLGAGYNASGNFNPYTTAPNTAHIVWTKELSFGGLIGGEYGSNNYYTGMSYERKFGPPLIINGKLYYNRPDPPRYGFYSVDLRTGETLWYQNRSGASTIQKALHTPHVCGITMGQIYDYDSPNQHGGIPYLWCTGSTVYEMYDAFTGDFILSIANASSGTMTFSSKGDILTYILNGAGNWLAMWNSSKAIPPSGATSQPAWQWRPDYVSNMGNKMLDWKNGIQWNITVPDVPGMQSILKIGCDIIYARSTLQSSPTSIVCDVAYDATTGEQLWVQNRTELPSRTTGTMMYGVFTEYVKETKQWYGYDVYTGDLLWGPTESYESAWSMYGMGGIGAYGKLYAISYDGRVHCHDLETGDLEWTYFSGSSGLETPYGHYPFYGTSGCVIADGKIYAANDEHSPSSPLYRGEKLYCIDAETGEGIWSILGWMQSPIIADGYIVANNGYDNSLYCFGKGPSKTTVEAPLTAISLGESVMIRGSVTDESPGTAQNELSARFPNGVPAIADESMTEWMEYLYMQQPCPNYMEGVEVKLETLDPNNNFYEIGTVTSDASGMFKLMWEPPVPGEYTIIATFEGSESYWSSYAETAIGVGPAATPSGPIEPEPTEAPFITTETALIASAIIVAIAVIAGIWIIRKRK